MVDLHMKRYFRCGRRGFVRRQKHCNTIFVCNKRITKKMGNKNGKKMVPALKPGLCGSLCVCYSNDGPLDLPGQIMREIFYFGNCVCWMLFIFAAAVNCDCEKPCINNKYKEIWWLWGRRIAWHGMASHCVGEVKGEDYYDCNSWWYVFENCF